MKEFLDLIDYCRGKRVYIQTHNFPDPDAIRDLFLGALDVAKG